MVEKKNIHDCLVSVRILAFNQEKYISRAIDSILQQKCNFRYEIVISEDCSLDRTREICVEYQKKYPHIIKLILNNQNLGLIKNFVSTTRQLSGKYIAPCAGDDYWCDEYKLQKQVDFLEENLDYSMCFTNAYEEFYFSWREYSRRLFANIENGDYSASQFITDWIIPASSVMYRNYLIDLSFLLSKEFYAEDLIVYLKLSERGKVKGFSDPMIVYTRHQLSTTNIDECREGKIRKYVTNMKSIDAETAYKYHANIQDDLSIIYFKEAKFEYKNKKIFLVIWYLMKSFFYSPMKLIKLVVHI